MERNGIGMDENPTFPQVDTITMLDEGPEMDTRANNTRVPEADTNSTNKMVGNLEMDGIVDGEVENGVSVLTGFILAIVN